jgi:hypothetical protein
MEGRILIVGAFCSIVIGHFTTIECRSLSELDSKQRSPKYETLASVRCSCEGVEESFSLMRDFRFPQRYCGGLMLAGMQFCVMGREFQLFLRVTLP